MKWLCYFVLAIGGTLNTYSQTIVGKTAFFNSIQRIEQGESIFIDTDTLLFGPDAELTILGTIEVQSPFIIIAPTARVEGSGIIRIVSDSRTKEVRPTRSIPTVLDGNGNLNFNVKVEIENRANLILGGLEHTFLNHDPRIISNNFYTGADVSLLSDGTCIELKGNRFTLGLDAVLQNCSSERMIISGNDINSTFSKKMRANSSYTFAIGLRKGDYSPVVVRPEKEAELFVNLVTSSVGEPPLFFTKKEGAIDRIWGVYADNNIRTRYIFEHSKDDGIDPLKGGEFEIFQFTDAQIWQLITTEYLGGLQHSTKNLASMYSKIPRNYFLKVGKVRNAPQCADDYATVANGKSSVTIPILNNDKQGDGRLRIAETHIVEYPTNGFVELLPSGEAIYRPVLGFVGSDFFVYEVVDEFGLSSRSTAYVAVEGEGLFILSNVLTPNGDGYNDMLVFKTNEELINLELTIVNRWGDRLYESKYYNNNWDGKGLSGGTYYYLIRGKRKNGDSIHQRGWLLLSK